MSSSSSFSSTQDLPVENCKQISCTTLSSNEECVSTALSVQMASLFINDKENLPCKDDHYIGAIVQERFNDSKSLKQTSKTSATTRKSRKKFLYVAAVTLTIPSESTFTYKQAMIIARQKINLEKIGLTEIRARPAITNGLSLEVPLEESDAQADRLVEKLTEVLNPFEIKVAANKKINLRLIKILCSETKEDLQRAIAQAGGCSEADVEVGNILSICPLFSTAWVRCPKEAGIHILKKKQLTQNGWPIASVVLLNPCPLHYFRYIKDNLMWKSYTKAPDIFQAANWSESTNLEEEVCLRETVACVCDKGFKRYRSPEWWSEEIEQLRIESIAARRQLQQSRRKRSSTPLENEQFYDLYRIARERFRGRILEAKINFWKELLEGLDEDPLKRL